MATKFSAHFADGLAALPEFTQLSARVWTILGMNPGKFTLTGTNTYLVGTGPRRILVDTGDGLPEYIDVLKKALQAAECEIEKIVITHHHHDHIGGIPSLIETFGDIPVWKYQTASELAGESVQPGTSFQSLQDGERITTEGATLQVMYTPGHTEDHVSLWLEEEESMLTGDCVLGTGTAVFTDLYAYMNSLQLLAAQNPKRLYCGHGPVVEEGVERIRSYIAHRQSREKQVLDVLGSGEGQRWWTAMELVKIMYAEVPQMLWPAAARNVVMVLDKLVVEGVAQLQPTAAAAAADGEENAEQAWCLVRAPNAAL